MIRRKQIQWRSVPPNKGCPCTSKNRGYCTAKSSQANPPAQRSSERTTVQYLFASFTEILPTTESSRKIHVRTKQLQGYEDDCTDFVAGARNLPDSRSLTHLSICDSACQYHVFSSSFCCQAANRNMKTNARMQQEPRRSNAQIDVGFRCLSCDDHGGFHEYGFIKGNFQIRCRC